MNPNRKIILASSSPRRQYLMKEAGFNFTVEKPDVEESFPNDLPIEQVAKYLAEKKAAYFRMNMKNELVVTADTVVILKGSIMNKPADRNEAIAMLNALSGNTHHVMTGVCIISKEKEVSFDDTTEVTFQHLTSEEIEFYVDEYKPYDKAGAYGAQDCLPAGMNPCSNEEMLFLRMTNIENLIHKTFSVRKAGIGMVAIQKIKGSYFNVMGLPIHLVYQHLHKDF